MIAGRLDLRTVYMTEDDRDDYLDRLAHSPLTDDESRRRWAEDRIIVPDRGVSAAQAVEDWLMDPADA